MSGYWRNSTITALEGVAAVLLVLVVAGPALSVLVAGEVVDARTGVPLAGANVALTRGLGSFCDAQGRFQLEAPPGTYAVEVTMVGYQGISQPLRVPGAGLEGLVFRLQVQVIPLDETIVERLRRQLPRFAEVADQAGIRFRHFYGDGPLESLLESSGAGVCFCDFDNDDYPDLFLVNGANLEDKKGLQPSDAFYHNNGDGTFTEVTAQAGLVDSSYGMGCAAGDYDNDGDLDLYVTNYGPNALYRNEGDGTFAEVGTQAGVADPRWSVCANWLDYDSDGFLDLFVGNYLDFDPGKIPARSLVSLSEGYRYYPGPRDYRALPDALYRNEGDGTFVEVSAQVGLNPQLGKAMGCTCGDYDNDGDLDLFVGNDRTPKQFYRDDGEVFAEIALWAGVAFDADGHETGAMAPDFGDYDNDGDLDLFVTNFSFEYNSLYRNLGEDTFEDVTAAAGLALPSYQYVGWGTGFFDYDNDGWLDLFVANGDVHEDMDIFSESVTFAQPNQLFHSNGDGTFTEVSAVSGPHFLASRVSRGVAYADYDNDGDLDIAVLNAGDTISLLRNEGGNRGNWLVLSLVGREGNRSAIGARVEVEAGELRMIREIRSGGSYLSQHDLRLFFGLGGRQQAEQVVIRWPDGRQEKLTGVPANRRLRVVEGGGYTELPLPTGGE